MVLQCFQKTVGHKPILCSWLQTAQGHPNWGAVVTSMVGGFTSHGQLAGKTVK